MAEIKIRRATLSDVPLIAELSKKTFAQTFSKYNTQEDMEKFFAENYSVEKLSDEMKNKDSSFFIAYSDDNAAAYMKINVHDAQTEEQGDDCLEVQRLYVLEAFKGQKIGGALMKIAEDEARAQKLSSLWLGVWEHNEKAKEFYAHCGFERFSEHVFVLGNDRQTDFLLRKSL